MSFRWWRLLNLCILWASLALTVFCITPGPGWWLAGQLIYITFVSHLALVLSALAVIAGVRAEESADDG